MIRHRHRKTTVSRAFAAGVVTAALALTAGCAGDNRGSDSSHDAEGRLPPAEGKVDYPLELETPYGTTTLEKRPERIAVGTTTADAENLLALGVHPVALIDSYRDNEWLADQPAMDDVEVWAPGPGGGSEEIPFEALSASEPDLLIAIQTASLGEQWEKASAVSPVLASDHPNNEMSWQESITIIGQALDLQDRAAEVIATTDEIVTSALDETPELRGQSLAVLMAHPTAGIQYRSEDPGTGSEFIQELGFTVPDFSRNPALETNLSVSEEQYTQIDADILLVFASPEEQAKLEDQPVFQSIEAVRNGNYAFIDQEKYAYATLWPTALSVPFVIEKALIPAFKQISANQQ